VELDAGTTVLLYTDGLVERRDAPLDAGLERLTTAAAERRDAAPAQLTADLARTLHDATHPDDVCLLAARIG
jgi:serine/threonine-protein kinase RsbW